jgi:cobalt/nickel transport system permease protein
MHMANEVLSVPTAVGACAVAGTGLALICRRLQSVLTCEKRSLMGILGAFVFAAQMVNVQLPGMPGTSGHLIGSVLLAIVLGPAAGALVISSVVIIQCLFLQDGGLLALGCNILNMGIVPSFLGFAVYKTATLGGPSRGRVLLASFIASVAAVEAGAALVAFECSLSGVLQVPLTTFLATLLGVHLLVGLLEGALTATVLAYLGRVRPDLLRLPGRAVFSRRVVLASFLAGAILCAGVLSLVASDLPDGLEWAYRDHAGRAGLQPVSAQESPGAVAAERWASGPAPVPDPSRTAGRAGDGSPRESRAVAGWTSLAGVTGSLLTMALVWLCARILRTKAKGDGPEPCQAAGPATAVQVQGRG